MRARFSIDPNLRKMESDVLVAYDVELSEYISRTINRMKLTASQQPLSSEEVGRIYDKIQMSNITDSNARSLHVKGIK